jgi:hypothetical protein
MMTNNLETIWLIRFILFFAIIFVVFALLRYFSIYQREKKHHSRFKIILLAESFSWLIFSLYFLYHFFIQVPVFTIIVLVLMILMSMFVWKDLLSGYIIKYQGCLFPGTRLLLDGEEWKVSKIGYLQSTLLNDSGVESIVPNQRLFAEKIGIINNARKDLKLEIEIDKEKLDQLGGWEVLSTQIMASPWATPKQKARLSDKGDGRYLLECWAFNPESKARYKAFIEKMLAGK